jgi:hypothetical protein
MLPASPNQVNCNMFAYIWPFSKQDHARPPARPHGPTYPPTYLNVPLHQPFLHGLNGRLQPRPQCRRILLALRALHRPAGGLLRALQRLSMHGNSSVLEIIQLQQGDNVGLVERVEGGEEGARGSAAGPRWQAVSTSFWGYCLGTAAQGDNDDVGERGLETSTSCNLCPLLSAALPPIALPCAVQVLLGGAVAMN